MKPSLTNEPISEIDADAVVVTHFENQQLEGPAAELNAAIGGTLDRLIETHDISGKQGEITTILAPNGMTAPRAVVVGLGERDAMGRGEMFRAISAVAKQLASQPRDRVVFCIPPGLESDVVAAAVCGSIVGCHGQDLHRSEKKLNPFGEAAWAGATEQSLEAGRILGENMNLTRQLVNEPANEIYPESFAARAEQVARETGLEIEVWDEKRLASERCGSLLAVARGSAKPPRLVILTHRGGPPDQPPVALVGKGVTFDSGGLSLKPSDGMKTMKCDMAGAATVLGAMSSIASLELPVNVIGLVGLVENMVSGDSYKLGDVLTARNGKTIEVLNTDAEGRLVLADVLDVAVERGANRIVDLATLTGACLVALGTDVAGLMSNQQTWCDEVSAAAKICGEPAWQLPMFPEYQEQIQSKVADIKNIGDGRWGGAITAAKFLEEFVADTPWVHIDIAGPAFLDSEKPYVDAGGTGAFVRTLVQLVESLGSSSP